MFWFQDKPGRLAKDKHRLILSLTPSGTEEEKSYRSLSSTPCGSLHSVRSRSHANLVSNGHHNNVGDHQPQLSNDLPDRRFSKSPSVSPKHRKKVVSSERMMCKTYSHDLEHSENVSTGETPSGILGDPFLPCPSQQPCASSSLNPFADQVTPKTSPKHLLLMNCNKNNSNNISKNNTDNFSNGLDPIASTIAAQVAQTSSIISPHAAKYGDTAAAEKRGACSSSRLAMDPGNRLTYESFASHPQYRNKQTGNFVIHTNGQFNSNNGSVSDDEDADVVETCDDLNESLPDHGIITNSRKASADSGTAGKILSSSKPLVDNPRVHSTHLATLSGSSCHGYHTIQRHQSSRSSEPRGTKHCGTPPNNQQQIPQPLNVTTDASKRELNQRISYLFGKIGGSAFELLDEHRESLGDCVNNEYTLASLFEHKSGSLFFYGIVDTIFWHPSSKTMSLVEFQTTIKTTPSPHYLLQLHCFKEIASKKKICKRIKLYILGLHLEPDGPRLKLWRYKPTGAMPSIKALLFDPKLHTQEKLYSCPEFNFMGRLLGKRGTEVVYEMV